MWDAIADGGLHAINYFVAQKYVAALTILAEEPYQKTVFMPMETSDLLASIGGIGVFAWDALDDVAAADRRVDASRRRGLGAARTVLSGASAVDEWIVWL